MTYFYIETSEIPPHESVLNLICNIREALFEMQVFQLPVFHCSISVLRISKVNRNSAAVKRRDQRQHHFLTY